MAKSISIILYHGWYKDDIFLKNFSCIDYGLKPLWVYEADFWCRDVYANYINDLSEWYDSLILILLCKIRMCLNNVKVIHDAFTSKNNFIAFVYFFDSKRRDYV